MMNNAMDCTGVDVAPERNHNPAAALYFVIYIVVVAFFLVWDEPLFSVSSCSFFAGQLNIFVGYVIITFGDEGEKYYEASGLDSNQRKCLHYALTANPEYAFQPDYRNQVRALHAWRLPHPSHSSRPSVEIPRQAGAVASL